MSTANSLERQMLELINNERTKRGLDPVKLELRLNDAAEDHSEWMLKADKFSHTGVGGSNPGDRMKDANFDFSGKWTWGENVAWQSERGSSGLSDDVVNLHNALMNSSGHRANILNPKFEYVGIGIERGDYKGWDAVMVTQNFAATDGAVRLDGGSAPAPAPAPKPAPVAAQKTVQKPVQKTVEKTPEPAEAGGDKTITGTNGSEILRGRGSDDDTMLGRNGNDKVYGNNGDDLIDGGAGKDTVSGGNGDDIVTGGSGTDRVDGGAGADTFLFTRGVDKEIIRDFQNNVDTLDMTAMGFDSVRDVLDGAREHRGRVFIDLGQGDMAIVNNATISQLQDDILV